MRDVLCVWEILPLCEEVPMLVVYGISYFGSLYIYRTPRTRCLQNVNSNSPPYTRAVLGADSSLIIFVVPDSEIVAVMFGLVAYIAPTSGATKKLTWRRVICSDCYSG